MGSVIYGGEHVDETNEEVDWEALEGELLKLMKRPSYDDGTLGPLFIRLAWHSSGTYDAATRTGGSNGATMRYNLEGDDPENAGLDIARNFLKDVKEKYPAVSCSDLWIFAAYVFIRSSNGPDMVFVPGRKDAGEDKAIAPGRLPGAEYGVCPGVDAMGRVNGWKSNAKHVREVFYRQGFNDKDIVALLCGGHVYGRCHTERSGYNGAWIKEPWKFSNEYADDMINDKWFVVDNKSCPAQNVIDEYGELDNPEEVRPIGEKRQYAGYAMDGESTEEDDELKLGDIADYPLGKWMVDSDYINIREDTDDSSVIIGRASKGETFFIISTLAKGKAVFGRISCGGWVALRESEGQQQFKQVAELELPTPLRIRILDPDFSVYKPNDDGEMIVSKKLSFGGKNAELVIREIRVIGQDHYGKLTGEDGFYLRLVSPEQQVFWERISKGWNEEPRYVNIPEVQTQMMLVSDMILLWDEAFKKHLEVYAEDEDALRKDFGDAFKRLTENGFQRFPEPVSFNDPRCVV